MTHAIPHYAGDSDRAGDSVGAMGLELEARLIGAFSVPTTACVR